MSRAVHYVGLDSIRFLAALWVAFAHGAAFPLRELLLSAGVGDWLPRSLDYLAFNGKAAVIVFFVISGFCIHLPYVDGRRLPVAAYLVRRFVRVGLPLLVATIAFRVIGGEVEILGRFVLWTLYCELIYYACYPLLLPLIRRFGVVRVVAAGFVLAALTLAAVEIETATPRPFNFWDWLICYPAWLLGCLLAERVGRDAPSPGATRLWIWRLAIWSASILAIWLAHHSPIRVSYPLSLPIFALLATAWLDLEIRHYRHRRPIGILESAGRGAYSIYLIHAVPLVLVAQSGWGLTFVANWLAKVGLVLAGAALLYILVERPAHLLARRLGERLAQGAVGRQVSATLIE